MSGGQVAQLTGELRRQQKLLQQAIADIELLKGDAGATGTTGATGAAGATGPTGAAGAQGVKGDAADAPIQSVNGYTDEVTLDMDDLPQGLSHISGGYTSEIIDVTEDKPKLSFAENFLYKAVVQTTAMQFGLLPADLAPRVQGATNIIPIHGDGSGITFTSDFFYFDGGSEAEIPLFGEAVKFILVLQYHENGDAVQVSIKHPQWLQRASADPTFLSFEWDAIHPEEVQSGAEVIDFVVGPPIRTNGKKVLLPFDSDASGVTWGPEFVDPRDGLSATLPDLADSEKYLLDMQYDKGADKVWTKIWPQEPLMMIVSDCDETQNCNQAGNTAVNWFNNVRLKASVFTHSTSSQRARLIVDQKGFYRFVVQLEFFTTTNGLGGIIIQLEKNGTTLVGPLMYTNHLDFANGYKRCSVSLEHDIVLAATDYIRVQAKAANAAFAAFPTDESHCYVEKIG